MLIERIAVALGFDLPKNRKPMTRLIAFAILGGGIFGAVWFVPTFVATVVIWRNAQGPLLAFGFLPFAFTIGATFGALSAWHE